MVSMATLEKTRGSVCSLPRKSSQLPPHPAMSKFSLTYSPSSLSHCQAETVPVAIIMQHLLQARHPLSTVHAFGPTLQMGKLRCRELK